MTIMTNVTSNKISGVEDIIFDNIKQDFRVHP